MDVLTTAEMERADRLTIAAGTPGFALMMSAGQAVAEAAMHLVEEGPILVVAGRGNNGGDGLSRPPSSPRAAGKFRSSCSASATASRAMRRLPQRGGNIRCCRSIPRRSENPR
jgi:hypothetical protein